MPDAALVETCQAIAKETGAVLEFIEDPMAATKNADVLYTDVWTSMGEEAERDIRFAALHNYQINQALLDVARPECIVLHCLPAHRGEEITEDVLEGPHSVVFDQAENRLHVQKAIMALLMSDEVL